MHVPRIARLAAAAAVSVAVCAGGSSALGAQTSHAQHGRQLQRHGRHTRCAHAQLKPTARNLKLIRAATLCLINRERTAHGEHPLHPNARLRRAAQAHSASMAFGDYFQHYGPQGQTPLSRIRAAGYISSSRMGYEVGENIAWGTLSYATPRAIVAGWMASPGHRANILDPRFRETGIGVSPHPPTSLAHGQAGAIYTQDFGVITGR